MGFPQIGLESIFKDAGFNKALDAYKRNVNDAKSLTDTAGASMGERFAGIIGGLGKIVAASAAFTMAAVVGAFTAVGTAAWKAGTDVDNAMDGIIIKTGATGEALSGLEEDFKRTLSNSASNVVDVGNAVGEASRQFGFTGDDLAEFSLQVLDATRLMGGDVTANVKDLSQAMKAFNLTTDDAVPSMEAVFVAARKSAVPFNELLTTVKTYAAPMKALKFSFKESVAMIGKWTSQGLDANKMVMAMRLSIANIVDPTKDAEAALEDIGAITGDVRSKFDLAVTAIQNATDETEAMNIGMSIFGKRGAVDLVTAIREGKFTADDFTAAMDASTGAIERTFQATKDWPEVMQLAKNQITVALEPIGTAMLDVAKVALESFLPAFEKNIVPFLNTYAVPAFKAITDAILLLTEGNFAGAIDALLPSDVITRWQTFSPLLGNLAGIVKTSLKGLTGMNIWEDTTTFGLTGATITPGLKSYFLALGGSIMDAIGQGLKATKSLLIMFSEAIAEWAGAPSTRDDAIQFGYTTGGNIVYGITSLFGTDSASERIHSSLVLSIGKALALITVNEFMGATATGTGILQAIFPKSEEVQSVSNGFIATLMAAVWNTPLPPTPAPTGPSPASIWLGQIFAGAQDFFKENWEAVKLWFMTAWDDVTFWLQGIWLTISDWFNSIPEKISGFLATITGSITTGGVQITDALTKPFSDAWAFIQTIPGLIIGAFTGIHIPMPHFSVSWGEIIPGLGISMPSLKVDWYGQGLDKIFNSPTLIGVGESGPERVSVMPLRGSESGRQSSPAGAMGGGGGGDNYWVLNITTAAPTENILSDYRLLASMRGAV